MPSYVSADPDVGPFWILIRVAHRELVEANQVVLPGLSTVFCTVTVVAWALRCGLSPHRRIKGRKSTISCGHTSTICVRELLLNPCCLLSAFVHWARAIFISLLPCTNPRQQKTRTVSVITSGSFRGCSVFTQFHTNRSCGFRLRPPRGVRSTYCR